MINGKFEWDVMYSPIGPKVDKRSVFANEKNVKDAAADATRAGDVVLAKIPH